MLVRLIISARVMEGMIDKPSPTQPQAPPSSSKSNHGGKLELGGAASNSVPNKFGDCNS